MKACKNDEVPSIYSSPSVEPAMTMAANYYFRLHLIMMEIDRSALRGDAEAWLRTLRQLYINIKPMILSKGDNIEHFFIKVELLLYDKKNFLANPRLRNYHSTINHAKAFSLLAGIQSYLTGMLNNAKMLFPVIERKSLSRISQSVIKNKPNALGNTRKKLETMYDNG